MQDVSCEPLMLWLSENPQASLDIFSQSHHHPAGSCIHRKAINKDKPSLSTVWYPTSGKTATSSAREGLFLFIALARMVTFCKEGGGMLSVWALRARSYKTKAEA